MITLIQYTQVTLFCTRTSQVLIQETGERRFLGVGVVWEGYEDGHAMPGWSDGTVGYHVDDGKIFDAENPEQGREMEGSFYAPSSRYD